MTIDEAIKQLTENYDFWMQFACDDVLEEGEHKVNNCEENANYCYQLIQWLEELKIIKEYDLDIPQHFTKEQSDWIKSYCIQKNKEFYNQGIDDFKQCLSLETIKKYAESDGFINLNDCSLMIYDVAEQLKGGARNDK